MTDLIKIVEDRRATLAAQQAEIVAELAKLHDFTRMMAILAEYDEGLNDDKKPASAASRVQILGLASGGRAHCESAGARRTVVIKGHRVSATTSDQPDPARATMNTQRTGRSATGADSFVFTDQSQTRRNE